MGKKKEAIHVTTNVGDAVNTAFEGIQELAEELRSWYDNLPQNLQYSDKGGEIDEAEGVSFPGAY